MEMCAGGKYEHEEIVHDENGNCPLCSAMLILKLVKTGVTLAVANLQKEMEILKLSATKGKDAVNDEWLDARYKSLAQMVEALNSLEWE